MKLWNYAEFIVWSLINLTAAIVVGFVNWVVMGLKYQSMLTSYDMDKIPGLTKEIVLVNILSLTIRTLPIHLFFIAIFWVFNFAIYPDDERVHCRKMGLWVSCACTFFVLIGVLIADVLCWLDYPSGL